MPVGVGPEPPAGAVTTTVKVTDCPELAGLREVVNCKVGVNFATVTDTWLDVPDE